MAGPVQHTFIAGGRWAFTAHLGLLACRGVPPFEIAVREPDSADRLLVERGEFLARHGFAEFLIASRDRYFAPFAVAHRTTVLTPNLHSLSSALRDAASGGVVVLPCG